MLYAGCIAQGHLEVDEIQRRVAQFTALDLPVLVTAAPLLVDKARLLPGAVFVVSCILSSIQQSVVWGLNPTWHTPVIFLQAEHVLVVLLSFII